MLALAAAISGAQDLPSLLQLILARSRQLTGSDAGSIYLVERGLPDRLWFAACQNSTLAARRGSSADGADRFDDLRLDLRFPITPERLVGWTALSGEVLNIADVYAIGEELPYRFDDSLDRELGYRAVSMLVVPLRTAVGQVVGVMQLINRKPDAASPFVPEQVRTYDAFDQRLIEALASLAAVCVERTLLLEGQQRQIDSMIALLAGAIDARSPHTGRHCSRVPELALMLAREAEAVREGPLAGFRFADERARHEFRTAAWLHDCGKVTTPDCVVDKATKLDAPTNRIHEIRTRFEVLLRDARIAQLEGLLAGGDPEALQARYEERARTLQDDFAFVARCNLGSEGMAPEAAQRLRRLAMQEWQRHFDDRLGLGWEERSRCPAGEEPLPATETLLADKPRHRVPRPPQEFPDPALGIRLPVPEYAYDRGELHNLLVSRGTLTAEEIYKVREHMVHTIAMLEGMAFPPGMERVPEYAGAHHETLDGSGYPRGLGAADLSIPARILAIADVFEALTAADRPYKPGKPLSEAVAILAGMRDRGRIDPDLFALFLRSGVHQAFAERFLPPEQIDAVDPQQWLASAGTA